MSSVDGESFTKAPTAPYPVVFLRCRTIAFCAITFFSFAWVVLLSIVVFLQWEFMDRSYQSTILVMIAVYAITVVLLLVMLTRRFRAWLDAARFMLLMVAHFGVSGAFALYSRRFSCPQPTPEDRNVCRVLILYILISSWLLPLLVTVYSGALGIMALYRWHLARPVHSTRSLDLEKESVDLKKHKHKHKSQTSSFLIGRISSPIPIVPTAARFSHLQLLDIPNRFTSMPTPTTANFSSASSFYSTSPTNVTPSSPAQPMPPPVAFPANPQPYLVPPPPAGSPTQLPYLMPPSPNEPASPQPNATTPSNAQPRLMPPSNPQWYPMPPSHPQQFSVPPVPPMPPMPPMPSMPSGNPYLTPNPASRQSRYSMHSNQGPYSPPLQNPYLVPPLPPHWNHNPPPTRSRHPSIATTLHESIPEETSSLSGDSDYQKRVSARLSKPPPSTRMPSL